MACGWLRICQRALGYCLRQLTIRVEVMDLLVCSLGFRMVVPVLPPECVESKVYCCNYTIKTMIPMTLLMTMMVTTKTAMSSVYDVQHQQILCKESVAATDTLAHLKMYFPRSPHYWMSFCPTRLGMELKESQNPWPREPS